MVEKEKIKHVTIIYTVLMHNGYQAQESWLTHFSLYQANGSE